MLYKRLENIPWQIVHKSAVIIDPVQNKIHELDEVATCIWTYLDGEHNIEQIADQLTQEYAVENAVALYDTQELCEALKSEGLLEIHTHE